jgi:hypothetical protein
MELASYFEKVESRMRDTKSMWLQEGRSGLAASTKAPGNVILGVLLFWLDEQLPVLPNSTIHRGT